MSSTFDQIKIPDFQKVIKELDNPVSIYIFSLGEDDFAEEFIEFGKKVKVCSFPESILRIYQRILR